MTILQRQGTAATIPTTTFLRIIGNLSYNSLGYADTESNINNYGSIKVDGDAKFSGEYSYFFGGKKKANFNNYGYFEVGGNLTMMEAAGTLKNEGKIICRGELGVYNLGTVENENYISTKALTLYSYYKEPVPYQYSIFNMATDAILEVSGDISIHDWGKRNIFRGTVVLNGTEQQKLEGLNIYNLEVKNPKGILYSSNLEIYGQFHLNGNPLDNNGCKTICYTGASFGDNSDYKDIYIAYKNTVTLDQSISGNFTGGENGGLEIPVGANVVINGSVFFGWGKVINNGSLTVVDTLRVSGRNSGIVNNGNLYALSDLLLTKDSNNDYGTLQMSGSSSVLAVAGDLSLPYSSCSKIYRGKVILNGKNQQNISNLNAPTIVLDNTSNEGVIFTSFITPSNLFNHKGNKFTLYNNGVGSVFADYDNDGLKDNVDPYPTVGNPCSIDIRSEDIEKGTVSDERIETFGGADVTVTATPTYKYKFSKWINSSGATVSTSQEYTFTVKEDTSLTAVFSKRRQNITRKISGGYIAAPFSAEIESTVKNIWIVENAGYIYVEGSLKYNGITVENNSFIMPDSPVVLTAEFLRNDNYFALKDKINQAKSYTEEDYTSASFAALSSAIDNAEKILNNHITAEESSEQIENLQNAIDLLSSHDHVLGEYMVTSVAPENGVGEKSAVCQDCHETVTVTYSVGLYGDADGDGGVTVSDVTILRRYLAGLDVGEANIDALNVHGVKENTPAKPNQVDLTKLVRHVAGWNGYDVLTPTN